MSLSLYEAALTDASQGLRLRHESGLLQDLEVLRWSGPPDAADEELLRRVRGPVLDIGCGPGRLGAALRDRGIDALGLDVSSAAVRLARRRGGHAVQGDVFGPVPRAGQWQDVLLIDGNVGIGGDPARLLARSRDLLAPGGSIHVEVSRPGGANGSSLVRLERPDRAAGPSTGAWFRWSWLSDCEVEAVAAPLGLAVAGRWQRGERWFAELSVSTLES